MKNRPKILVILGPTSTGKSDLAVLLAKKFNGEVISADSRQVYKDFNLGTGKITHSEMGGIKHHLLDITSAKNIFTVIRFKKLAERTIQKILSRGHIPIICGGTGLYIQSLVENIKIPEVPPNLKLRKELGTKTAEELFSILEKIDKRRSQSIDRDNRVRLIRAIEIARVLGKVPSPKSGDTKYQFLQIGLRLNKEKLDEKIHKRLLKRIKDGMIDEVRKLKTEGISWKRLYDLGLEYRHVSLYLRKKITKDEMITQLETAIKHYAKRQMTWFKRDKSIHWFEPDDRKNIEKLVARFIK